MHNARIICLVLVLTLLPTALLAFDLTQLRLNGFVSQGYMKTDKNDWLATDSTDGTTQILEAGLTINVPVNDKLRVGMQFLSRDLGDEGNNDIRLDWAFGDYRFDDALGVRLGKVKMPIGLYNEGRDSDFLRNMAFLPQSVYDETRRNLLVASQGGQLYGNISLGAAGDLDYAAYGGQINFPDDSPTLQAFFGFAQMAEMNFGGNNDQLLSISADNEYVYGGRFMYNTVLDGLKVGVSFFEGKADFRLQTDTPGKVNNLRVRLEQMYIGSLEYATPYLIFAGEYIQFEQPAEYNEFGQISPSPALPNPDDSMGYYAMLTVPTPGFEALSFTVLYDAFYRDKGDKDGVAQSVANGGMPAHYFYREDFGVGFRYDFSGNWLIKAEWHDIEGADLLTNYFNDGPGAFNTEKDWNYYIVKTSFNF